MLPRLTLAEIDGFLALVAQPQPAALSDLELRVVEDLDRFRAPLTEADIARRRPERLTERQREHLTRYGYPFVGADFTWHMTLTGQLPADQLGAARMALAKALPPLPDPHPVSRLALMGEDAAGRFHLIRTAALAA